jgi:protein-S-isoprenylcysteine O-methyltransferase Ste14
MWTKIRLRSAWALVPLYLLFAQPTIPLMLAGLVVALFGVLIRAWAAGSIRKNKVLTTHGPYAFTRNPLYVGSFLIGIGFGIAAGVLWILALFLVFFLLIYGRTMRKEERRLEQLFGDEFTRYATAVPRFVPRFPAWSDVVGETSPARPAQSSASAERTSVAVADAPSQIKSHFRLSRYLGHREYEALLGIAVMYIALAIKLAL